MTESTESTSSSPVDARMQQILDSPPPFSDDKDRETCEKLLEGLSMEQQEILAQSSYVYWTATKRLAEENGKADKARWDTWRRTMCLREIRRHMVGTPVDRATVALQGTCEFRSKELKADILRTCFDEGKTYANEEDAKLAETYRTFISQNLDFQTAVVRGHDKEGLAIVLIFPRTSTESYSDEAFVITQLYVMERAIACTENFTDGRQEKVVAVFDFTNFQSKYSPTIKALKKLISTLQNRYPERLKTLIIIDPPFWMRSIYAVLKPFLDPDTKKKFIIANGKKSKQDALSKLVDDDQAMPFMLPEGKLTTPVDVKYFTAKVPFQCLYDAPLMENGH